MVVPTRNNARTIEACLRSLREQTHPFRVVVVDNASSDATATLARPLADVAVDSGPERSVQRNFGAGLEPLTSHLGFVDSDMRLAPTVIEEAAAALKAGAVAVVIPEMTVGEGYWARVRTFERSFYAGNGSIEAACFFRRAAFAAVGGFDETLTGPEDWDLTIKVRSISTMARTQAAIKASSPFALFGVVRPLLPARPAWVWYIVHVGGPPPDRMSSTDDQHLPLGRCQVADRHLKFHTRRDNLPLRHVG